MASIDFSEIKKLIDSSTDFSLSEKQYKKLTGREMPTNKSYLIHNSALSRFANELGLAIKVHENEKTITFEKK